MGPASHPIRGEVPDVSQAMANFDAISYQKGQAVLKQLSAYVGEEAFLAGLQAYFRDHAWGNTRLEDLTGAVGAAAVRTCPPGRPPGSTAPAPTPSRSRDGTLTATGPDGDAAASAPPRHRLLRRRR